MSDVAGAAGVSRQTLYKEFGSRDEFAQAFVIHVGERFLGDVDAAVREHLDDPRAAINAALETFLRTAGEDSVVRVLLTRRRHRRHAALRHHPGHAGRRLRHRAAVRDDQRGLARGAAGEGAAARRVAGAAGDQLRHRPLRRRPRRPRARRASCSGPSSTRRSASPARAPARDDLRPDRASATPRSAAPTRGSRPGSRPRSAMPSTVVNVGAGTGSYEPAGREVTAVEPSRVMIEQRAAGRRPGGPGERRGPALRGRQLRRRDGDDHRPPLARPGGRGGGDAAGRPRPGRRPQLRPRAPLAELWFLREYFPRRSRSTPDLMPPLEELSELMGGAVGRGRARSRGAAATASSSPSGTGPEMHLDPEVRQGQHDLARAGPGGDRPGASRRSRADLESGAWDERHGHLREETPELDLGLRLLVAELGD